MLRQRGRVLDPGKSLETFGATYSVDASLGKGGIEPIGDSISGRCGGCSKKVKDDQKGILCDVCDTWYHIECGHLSDTSYKLYGEENGEAVWVCRGCRDNGRGAGEKIRSLQEENDKLRIENEGFKKALDGIVRRMDEMESKIVKEIQGKVLEKIEEELLSKVLERVKDWDRVDRGLRGDSKVEAIQEMKGEIIGNLEEDFVGKMREEVRDREEIVKRGKTCFSMG